ncbi:septum site-determining protein MinC [Thiomicrorhabdus sediminis]|uniref:Probable septum site-determining protein MinC n=1 Tax=Thiomicrorhabdus sediminis TaxID=2580412 RepID=A0A4P9K5G5_9GAMM|nr:septum site-determining protein MinC [Thiomicrorhabdus sediminis]QCU90222.1 hypothetical protein FE785_06060 [Thiomicrorhabdus sediminis]
MTDNISVQVSIDRAHFSLAIIQVVGKDLKSIAEQLDAYRNSADQQRLSAKIAQAVSEQSVSQNGRGMGLPIMPDEAEPTSEEPLYFVPCVLDLQDENIEPMFLAQLVELSRQYNFLPIGLQSHNLGLAEQAAYAGLALFSEHCHAQQSDPAEESPQALNALLLEQLNSQQNLSKTIESAEVEGLATVESIDSRSPLIHYKSVVAGEQVYAQGRDLVILGDVEAGAEVIADGSIHIGGALMGKAYAANNEEKADAEVCIKAYSFEPELISIAGFYQLQEDIPAKYSGLSVAITWQNESFAYQLS